MVSRPPSPGGIHWPARYDPAVTPIHVRNELSMKAPAPQVWRWLLRAPLWPQWYPNSKRVVHLSGAWPDLGLHTRFRWTTFGVRITSEVLEYEPGERLAWDAKGIGVDAYHAWWVHPTPPGCVVLTEETQYGFAARLGALAFPTRMFRYHQLWLERLAAQAEAGEPPGP
jgi:uncharacterized protein YndB with AHSA1/START domain